MLQLQLNFASVRPYLINFESIAIYTRNDFQSLISNRL